jgi:hypothetical protein
MWNPCGIQVEQQWNLYHSSRWIPEHHSIWNGGIHVEYRWNRITKMAGISPKTYSIWNGWNPPGMIWIPHGFHVECGGRVKTSFGVSNVQRKKRERIICELESSQNDLKWRKNTATPHDSNTVTSRSQTCLNIGWQLTTIIIASSVIPFPVDLPVRRAVSLSTLQCPTDSVRNPVIPPEWHRNSS